MTASPLFNFNGLDILVVEDDPTSLLFMSRILAKYGGKVETASGGCDALAKFEQHRFAVIVTDIGMPVMNGLDLVRRIRQQDTDVQIIATTANRETDCLITAIELGFNDYILKPVQIEKLLWAVKRCSDSIVNRQRLEDEQQKFRTVLDCLGEGLAIKDPDLRIIYQNSSLTEMMGDHVGSRCYQLFGQDAICEDCPSTIVMARGETYSDLKTCQKNGKTHYIEVMISPLRDSRGTATGSIEVFRDVSERISNEQTIRDMAFHDPLTGLPNRRLFEDRLEQAVAKSHRYQMKFGLLYLDLDHFKRVNDTLGHDAGDLVLVEAGERIRSCCKRDIDTISRQGGDEFCVIINDCHGRAQLREITDQLLHEFSRPFLVQGASINASVSIGVSLFPDDSSEAKGLETAADAAMYAAKNAGRNTCVFSRPEGYTAINYQSAFAAGSYEN